MDLKIKDVAELLRVSETTIRRWLADGKIPAYRIHHQYRFSRIEIENWMMCCKLKETKESHTSSLAGEGATLPEMALRGGMQHFCLYRAIHQGDVFASISGQTKEEMIRGTTRLIAQKLGVDAEMLSELLIDREAMM